jgi:hypothetical protein
MKDASRYFPAGGAVRFDKEESVGEVVLRWAEGKAAKDFDVQFWTGHEWQTVQTVRSNTATTSTVSVDKSKKTKAVRIWITAPVSGTIGLAEVYMH